MDEQQVQNEMRLFALESIICHHLATVYRSLPPEIFPVVRRQAIEGAKKQTFAGADAVTSDLLSAELETAIQRLYNMIGTHLERFREK
jgi:hypothetical protein